ncbi:MAG: hypothetical protein HYU27_04255 [Acidobacteria bacterium]|nr:hypothetical protein [Acidobacteriota bacterium]
MRGAVLVLISSVLLFLASAGMAQEPTRFKPVANAKQLMEAFIIPSSDALFDVSSEPPKNDVEWRRLRNNALILAESGNLLMMGSPAKDKDVWMKYSRELVDAGAVALKAVEAKNVDAVIQAGEPILAACQGCHDRFLLQSGGK